MAFTPGNDTNLLQSADQLNVGAGAGDDVYIVNTDNLTDGQTITITDTQGANTLRLVGGITIDSTVATGNTLVLTLSNGAAITVLGADTFTYQLGGDALTGAGSVEQDYATLLTSSLGYAEVPGNDTPVDGTGGTVNQDGTVTDPTAGPSFSITAGETAVAEGNDATWTVNLDNADGAQHSVKLTVSFEGGATEADLGALAVTGEGITFDSVNGVITFAAGASAATVTQAIATDTETPETGEGVTMTLSDATDGAEISATADSASISITDVPPPPQSFTLSAAASSFDEGSSMTYTVTATDAVEADTTFNWSLAGTGDNPASAADFSSATSGTVTILAGQTTATFAVSAVAGDEPEFPETFKVTVTDSTGTAIGDVTTTINDTSTGDSTPPVVTADQSFSYAENQAEGATLATVVATDNVGVVGYEIASGNDDGYFAIDDSGVITLTAAGAAASSAADDFESEPNTFTLGVTASDAAGNVSTAVDVVLNVTDVDDTAPSLDSAILSGTSLVLSYDETLDPASVPAPSEYQVFVGGATQVAVNSVTVNGNAVTLELATAPTENVTLNYTPGANPLRDAAGNSAAALTGTTVVVDTSDPAIVSSSPADDATDVAVADNIVITFDEPVLKGTGAITITNAGDPTDTRSIDVTSDQVTVNGGEVTINPTADLKNGANYSIQIAATAFQDLSGNAFAGITDQTTLNFSTVANTGNTYSFTLATVTGSSDDFAGTTGDDSYNAGANNSLETGDVANDPSTTDEDTLDASFNATAGAINARPTLTNVENINARIVSGDAAGEGVTFDLSQTTGTNQLALTGGTTQFGIGTDVDFFGITSLNTTIKVEDINLQANAFDANFTFLNTLLGGASDAVTVGLSNLGQARQGGAVAPNLSLLSSGANSGIETVNLSVSDAAWLGAFNVDDSAAATQLSTLNISGAGTFFGVGADIDFVAAGGTINASGLSNGGIRVGVAAGDNVTVTGGGGNDRVDFDTFTNASDSYDGGTGTDTIVVDTALTTAPTNWTSVEIFAVDNTTAALTQDMDNVGNSITQFGIFGTGQNVTFDDMPDASTVTFSGAAPNQVDLILKSDTLTDTLSLVFNRGAGLAITDLDIGTEAFNTNMVETLNITANAANAGVEYQITNAAGVRAQNITISGSTDVDLGDVLGGTDTALDNFANQVINASALTGRLGVLGGANVQQITGGSGNDILMGGAGADILVGGAGNDRLEGDGVTADDAAQDKMTGGAGQDTFVFDDAGDHDAAVASADVIQDFVSGTDVIELANAAFALGAGTLGTGEYVEMTLATYNATAVQTQASALGIAAATNYVAIVRTSDSNRTYVVYDDNAAGNDGSVEVLTELAGVDLTGVASTDFTIV